MADPLMHNPSPTATQAAPRHASFETMPQDRRPQPAALLLLYPDKAGGADHDEAGADSRPARDDLHRRPVATAERLRSSERHALSREIVLLRELLSDRDKRIAGKDRVIADLRRRLAAADAERHAMQRRLTGLLTDRRGGGLRGVMKALGQVLDAILAAPPEPPSPALRATERPADAHPADRARAEQALLEQIARHHRQWARRGEGVV